MPSEEAQRRADEVMAKALGSANWAAALFTEQEELEKDLIRNVRKNYEVVKGHDKLRDEG